MNWEVKVARYRRRANDPYYRHWLLREHAGAPVWSMLLFLLIVIGLGVLTLVIAVLG